MSMLQINNLIQSERNKRGISQEELAYDVCSTSTLSRIERGLHFPKKSILLKLFDKLYNFSNIRYDPERESLSRKINHFLDNEEYDKIFLLKKSMEKLPIKSDYYLQYIGMCEVYIDLYTNENIDIAKLSKKIKSLLAYTFKYYNENDELEYYLSDVEANLIFLLAKVKEKDNDIKTAIKIIDSLQHCLQTKNCHISETFYIKVLKNQIHIYKKSKHHINIQKIADIGIKYCKTHSFASELLYFKFYKTIYNSKYDKDKISQCITSIYYSYKAINEEKKSEYIKEISEKEFNYYVKI